MEDPRKSDLKKLTNAISFLQKRKASHEQQAIVEEQKLQQTLATTDAANKKIEQMGKVQDMRWLLSQDHHEMKILNDTLQTFLDMNQDMKDTVFYKAAVQYIDEQCNKSELEAPPPPK